MAKINVKNTEVTVIQVNRVDYISLTDIAKFKTADPNAVIG
ncbi:MAG: KilA-N domain-containing protein, partial [Dysgonamonadaceae bacterium]|nr:KilA-N domain-containing protein [Dysgonamonadaceae bacterium]